MNLAPLAPLYERPGPWASVYVDTSATDQSPTGRRALRTRQVCADLAEQGADEATREAVRDALEAFATEPPEGGGETGGLGRPPGRALFASHGEVVLDPPLTVAPATEAAASWARLPHVAPLLELAPDEPRCLVAYIDRIGADFELRTAAGREPAGSVDGEDWPVHRTATSEWDERHFQLSVENTWAQNAKNVADAITAKLAETGAQVTVLAGDDRERRTVRVHLPRQMEATVVESPHGGRARGADSRLLEEDVSEAMRAYARDRTAGELDRFRMARTMSGGSIDAAEGVPALVEAAREHRIGTLFVQPQGSDARREVWAGPQPDQIALRRTETRYLGEPEPFAARADDALIRSATMTGADAVVVEPPPNGRGDDIGAGARAAASADQDVEEDEAQADELRTRETQGPTGGLGALLRWPYATEHPHHEPGTAT
ncbi:Vms1/Ankzf1 family peptidyl-tRNA hydrolase [Streptomyces sp. NRRL F-5126]|uniref:baeRF2 domain-containing protein n=1 Tax=Streptomyces sp. NRRL F-5126 TaxID=1463857 RepID=UPI0004CC0AD8|nr:Vms1/Ankzf1 family peptidyl-tRNA hydrolase [Streptomyces sp. NRRL F-5126]